MGFNATPSIFHFKFPYSNVFANNWYCTKLSPGGVLESEKQAESDEFILRLTDTKTKNRHTGPL